MLAFISCSKDNNSSNSTKVSQVYFMETDTEALQSLSVDLGKVTIVKKLPEMYGVGLAYDKTNKIIYFSDYYDEDTPNGKIWKMNEDGSNAVAIVSGLLNPFGIALDTNNGKIYWGDENGSVSYSNLDGSNVKDAYHIEGGAIRAVAIDQTNKKLYFYDVQNNNLYKSDLDGKNESVIITGYYGYAIGVDEINSKIYFDAQTDDETVSALYRANLDGSTPTMVDNTKSRIYGIAIDQDAKKVYWSARDTSQIYQANLNGTDKVIIGSKLGSPRGIFIK
jgi:hypothetical protein